MTRAEAIAELVRIWHSPHLDLSLKAGLAEAIEVLEGADGDLISRQDAIKIIDQFSREEMFHYMESLELDVRATQICHSAIEAVGTIKEQIEALPSAEPKTNGVLEQIRWERDVALKTLEEHGIGFGEKPKTGEWTYLHGSIGSYMTISCPFCGTTFNDVAEWEYNYCPSCGERMKGGDDK